MKKKVVRAITGLLCAAMVFSNMARMRVYAMGDGAGQEAQMQESVSGNDDTGEPQEEARETGQEPEEDGTKLETGNPEEPAEPGEGDHEKDGQEKGETEEGGEETEDEEEESEEREPEQEDSTKEPEEREAGTVSENTVETGPEEEPVLTGMFFSPRVYSAGETFTVDGKTYNSLDADETYSAGDDITAYYFAADSLLYFTGTGAMEWTGYFVPWYRITPEKCVIGEGITTVGARAFYWPNHSLKSVSLPGTLQVIGERGFYQCSELKTVLFPEGLQEIGKEAFFGCHALASIDIPESVTALGESAFYECRSAASIHVPGSIKEIVTFAFAYCEAAETVEIGEGVETIGDTAFQSCGVRILTLPGSVKTIGERAFGNSKKLYSITIPDSVTQIGPYAFTWCNSLFEITIGTGVTTIGEKAFVVEKNKLFRLYSENEVVRGYDWAGDRRVIAYRITFKCFDDSWSMTNLHGVGEKLLDFAPNVLDYSTDEEVFTFERWEPELTEESVVSADAEYTAMLRSEARKYHVVFKDYDGSVLSDITLPYGTVIHNSKPANPQRAADEYHTYRFSGWKPALTEEVVVTGDVEYTASYTSTARKYSVRFVDYDGTLISETALPYGAVIHTAKPVDPQRAADEWYTYQFCGWKPALIEDAVVTGDAEYTASYTSVEREYSIRFLDHDGSVISDLQLPYGADIHASKPADPKRAPDERHTYQFDGWEPELTERTAVTGDAEYTASYTSAERLYLLSFVDHTGSTIKTVTKPYGTKIADHAPQNPTREPDGAYTYTFAGWQPAFSETDILTKDTEYQAVFTSDAVRCRVVFQNYDGSVLKEISVAAGETVGDRAPAAARTGEGHSTYTFAGWQPALDENAPIIGDITYKALYTRKTQTGVLAENELNHPAGDGIGAGDIRLYPVYEIFDTSGHFQERLTDRERPVEAADIRLSKDRIEKGSNRIEVLQISTGFRTEFSIFGNYIDGITAELKDRELKTGSRLRELDVYFTRNRMGEDGQVKGGIADRTVKVRRYTFADGAAYVIIRKGDNAIRVTEKETGENHSCTIHVTGVGKEQGSNSPKEEDKPDQDAGEQEQPSPSKKDIWKIALDIPQEKEADTGRSLSFALDDAAERREPAKAGDPFTLILRQADKAEKAGSLQEGVKRKEPVKKKESVAETEKPQEKEAEDGNRQAEPESPEKQDDGQAESVQTASPLWIIPAALAVMGMLALLFMLAKGRRRVFHGILTTEENPSVKVDAPDGMDETVQEVIDRSDNLEECLEELRGSGAKTYLPASARMEISCRDADGQERTVKGRADEDRMFGALSRIEDCDAADVRLFHDRYGIDIRLKFRL